MGTKDIKLSLEFNPDHYFYRNSWVQLIRPMTLTGTLTPILVGTGFAAINGTIRFDIFFALLLSSLLVQAATNMLNDYYDFKYGQDQEKWIASEDCDAKHGPAYRVIPYMAGVAFAIAIAIGLWLAFSSSMWVILTGTLGIAVGIKYSAGSNSYSSIGMGEAVAFLFLGPVVTSLAYTVQGNMLDFKIIAISLPFALLIASMILTNNIRDLKKDIGFRRTLANMLGRVNAVKLLVALLLLAYVTVILLIFYQVLPLTALSVVFASPVAIRLLYSYRKQATRTDEIVGMKWVAMHHWVFGLLYALGLWVAG